MKTINEFTNYWLNPFQDFGLGNFGFGKKNKKMELIEKTNVRFDDVAGIDEAKQELEEVVSFLREPYKFFSLGANIPRGILLVGPPGTGKTLLAKAVAGEADVPFFNVSGSEFIELFVGIGAARMREIFEEAKYRSPCIVFIDEIDTIARQRGSGAGSSNDEKEQTLNQLLTELDGFESNDGVLLLAATNRVDVLDRALLRPGRFDRQIAVNLPSYQGRIKILKVHSKGKLLSEDFDYSTIARRTIGFSGADLANLMNEAAINAAREDKLAIDMDDIDIAIDKIRSGLEGAISSKIIERRLIAYHEAGHGILGATLEDYDIMQKMSIIPRGRAKGLTLFVPDEDFSLPSRDKYVNRLKVNIAGRAIEDCIFGKRLITTGARGDIKSLTKIIRRIVTKFGMTNLGPVLFNKKGMRSIFLGQRRARKMNCSELVLDEIDNVLYDLVEACYSQVLYVLNQNRFFLDYIVEELVEEETIESERFQQLIKCFIPAEYRKNYNSLQKLAFSIGKPLEEIYSLVNT